jgi:hypothetical protein
LAEDEKDFEQLLSSRKYEQPDIDLERRIINSAKSEEQIKSESIWSYIEQLFSTFHIPVPAMALSILLILGITIGYLYDDTNSGQQDEVALNDFLYYQGGYYE